MLPFISTKNQSVASEAVLGGMFNRDDIIVDLPNKLVYRRDHLSEVKNGGKVALISGGGSGHEPAHAGFVGLGGLTASVNGEIFASPSVNAILTCIKEVTGPAGCLLIVKNYTGDRLNFSMAAEEARQLGLRVELVFVGDDVAIASSRVGRRGLAGVTFYHKVMGAAAEKGVSLDHLLELTKSLDDLVTFGVSFNSVFVPTACTAAAPSAEAQKEFAARIPVGKAEVGLGIHGEHGCAQVDLKDIAGGNGTLLDADVLSSFLVKDLLERSKRDHGIVFNAGDEVAVLINSLGAVGPLELSLLSKAVACKLNDEHGLSVSRLASGALVTSLNAQGFSVTLLKLKCASILDLIDATTNAPAFPAYANPAAGFQLLSKVAVASLQTTGSDQSITTEVTSRDVFVRSLVDAVAKAILENEERLNQLDAISGDGDCGRACSMAAVAFQKAAHLSSWGSEDSPVSLSTFMSAAKAASEAGGGSSGALYRLLLSAFASKICSSDRPGDVTSIASAAKYSVEQLCAASGASKGDRTMIDAILPAVEALVASTSGSLSDAITSAAEAAKQGAESTRSMGKAALGRSSYIPEEKLRGHADPGAEAVAVWIQAVATFLKQ